MASPQRQNEPPSPWSRPPGGPHRPRGGGRRKGSSLWLLFAAVGGIIVGLFFAFPERLDDSLIWPSLIAMVGFLILIASSSWGAFQARPGTALRYAGIWLAIGAVIFAGYSLRHEFESLGNRMAGELLPGYAAQQGESVILTQGEGGHFRVRARVNGTLIPFLVDTGATDVVLSPRDAERIGLNLSNLAFTRQYRTANGTVMGAPITLDSISFGGLEVRDVRASVNGAALGTSLLGMSFLGRLSGFRVEQGQMILVP